MKLKKDKYSKARGGKSKLLDIICSRCKTHICFYQKDGPGILKRMYFDRIEGVTLHDTKLVCSSCKQILGTKMVYEKENRLAYRLFVGAVSKKIVS